MKTNPLDTVLIVDFGSQVTQLIARRIREAKVYCEIIPFQKAEIAFDQLKPKAIILSGSPYSSLASGSPRIAESLIKSNVPILGICYGQQIISLQLGGVVEAGHNREFGKSILEIKKDSPLFSGLWQKGKKYQVWMSHGDCVTKIPEGFEIIATSEGAPLAVIANEMLKIYGVQFHPEVVHTPDGAALIRNFLFKIADLKPNWSMTAYRKQAVSYIKHTVKDSHVICGLSGGVDSTVTAALIQEAVGDKLTCIFVDHGLLRKNEAEEVTTMFKEHMHFKLVVVNAKEKFLLALNKITDPEEKRKIIGRLFIETFEEEAKKIKNVEFLAQGTLYPDIIESISLINGEGLTIKSHHNVGGLPDIMNLKLIEPLRSLFKDEVRVLGRDLGLPEWFVKRHPFPGPGLAIRCPGEVTQTKLNILREADMIYIDEIKKRGLYDVIWQAFAVLLPVQTVGVMGDGRTYEYACALRAVVSVDGMTADFYPYDMKTIGEIGTRIINEVRGINRIVYDITSKPPSTIEWE